MWQVLLERLRQGHRTAGFPDEPPALPDRFRGHPLVDASKCPADCRACIESCPTEAIAVLANPVERGLALDLGRCLFCRDCVDACPEGAIRYTNEHRMAARRREDLVVRDGVLARV